MLVAGDVFISVGVCGVVVVMIVVVICCACCMLSVVFGVLSVVLRVVRWRCVVAVLSCAGVGVCC